VEKPYWTIDELADLFGYANKQSLHNAISLGRFPCPTYKIGKHRVADKAVVESFFISKRDEGLAELGEISP